MRDDLMDFLLEHANHIAGGLMSFEFLAMLHEYPKRVDIEDFLEGQYLHSGGLFPLDENCHP